MRLLDALEQIDLILSFAKTGKDVFLRDALTHSGILHRLALTMPPLIQIETPSDFHPAV